MTFSFLWWLPIVKAPYVKRLEHGTNTLLIEVAFTFVWRLW